MALQAFTVLRAQDPALTGAQLIEITPKNWRRYPTVGVDPTTANAANEGKPRYSSMTDWAGGVKNGEDPRLPIAAAGTMTFNTATVSLATDSGGAAAADYTPRTQFAKIAAGNLGNTISSGVADVTRPRGSYPPS